MFLDLKRSVWRAPRAASRPVAVILASSALVACATDGGEFGEQRWLNPALDPDRRAELVIAEMTLDEKIALLHGPMALPFGPDADPLPRDAIPAAGYFPGNARLGLPPLRETTLASA
ncbi:MAG: hypothetical protein PVI23_10110 [Maricaulaceae bacterium]|jgi:beta-glucosidase